MLACSSCGYQAPDDFAYCPKCGSRLDASSTGAPGLIEERKVVTTLFCDLVGFTSLSEAHDHENVDAMLRAYATCARRILEAHGGVVEKFIGDAVVAVFGFPRAHDDDAVRAVRAGLRIAAEVPALSWPGDTPLAVRVGINTGETYLHPDVDPGSGQTFLTGDAVNTAARLQSSAPAGGVVAGELTWRLSERSIDYQELPAVAAKGKARPVRVWLARADVADAAQPAERSYAATLVGRARELGELRDLLDEAIGTRTPGFALVLGGPGIGKSRLIHELSGDAGRGGVAWCEASCPAYGDGIAFRPLAELVRLCAGIREGDPPEEVDVRLTPLLAGDPDSIWLGQRVHALLGLPAPAATAGENFAAWARVLELAAAGSPLALIIEDLHWADDSLLAFLEALAGTTHDVPLLLVASARPELFEDRAELVAAEFRRIALEPLEADEVTGLVLSLLDGERVTEELRALMLERTGGNPLYAEEYVRLLLERGLVSVVDGGAGLAGTGELPLPDSLQALIAARLDLLARERKAMLADASVVGPTFWTGSLPQLDRWQESDIETGMTELSTRQYVSSRHPSSLAAEDEFVFWHALAHEVVYGQLPRAARARKHAAAAAWLEQVAPERVEDLVHQYTAALDLAAAVRDADLVQALGDPAVRVLIAAGDSAAGVDVVRAEQRYARALALMDEHDVRRPRVTVSWASALESLGRLKDAVDAYEGAVESFRAAGDVGAMAFAMERRAFAMGSFNDDEAHRLAEEAHALIRGLEPTADTATVEADWVGWLLCMERHEEAVLAIDRAIETAGDLGLPPPAKALGFRGWARCEVGDRRGVDDFSRALEAAETQGLGRDTAIIYSNMGEVVAAADGPARGLRIHREGRDFAERRGIGQFVLWLGRAAIEDLVWAGRWDEAADAARELTPKLEAAEDVLDLMLVRANQVLMDAQRGADPEGSVLRWLEEVERGMEPEVDVCCDVAVALHRQRAGDAAGALRLLEDFRSQVGSMAFERVWRLPTACRIALEGGDPDLARRLADGVEPLMPVHEHVLATTAGLLAEARGEHAAAAESFAVAAAGWHDFGVPYEEAEALLGRGRCLTALGGSADARGPASDARAIFARLGATPGQAAAEDLLRHTAQP
jgi:class 3 adenylate cyclase/tetratricopeptide (TPR) repeat protein